MEKQVTASLNKADKKMWEYMKERWDVQTDTEMFRYILRYVYLTEVEDEVYEEM